MMEAWQEFWRLFDKGGFVMPLLLAGSLLSVAVAVERFRTFQRATAGVDAMRERLSAALLSGDWTAALAVARQYDNLAAQIATSGLSQTEHGSRAAELAMEGAANRGAARLRQRLDLMNLMVTLAPLLGLLGTVIGMIRSFSVLNLRSGQPFAITGGVGEALVATAAGLCVAVLSLVLLAYFRNRLDGILNDAEETAALILQALAERQP
ncbi:MAG: MotA/TolQ/ExbB proton channel family protein [Veillonellaceae bacterium]|nr:MotA/TolQ/ExbB proton channel family protein [Veillonellaceae bacterium]